MDKDMSFEEYVKGKRIALVGPSSTMLESTYGKEIDGFDIVIRLNKALPLPTKYIDNLGSKTDILCNCLEPHPHTGGSIDPVLWKSLGVKYVLAPFPKEVQRNTSILKQIDNVSKHIPLAYNTNELFVTNKKNLLASPTTGFSCLMFILSLDIKELSIYGMDFYRNMPYKEYFQNKVPWSTAVSAVDKHRNEAKDNVGKQMKGHNIDSEFIYFKEHIYGDKRITIDNSLKQIIENDV